MNTIDYLIIGAVVVLVAYIIIRRLTGKGKGCSCNTDDCANCPGKKHR